MERLRWTWIWLPPFAGAASVLFGGVVDIPPLLLGLVLIITVLAAVHHAELIAHKVGEPFGTFLLALAVTVIEVGLILTLMLQGKSGAETLARDTVFSAVMIILNGLVGAFILLGALRHREQSFQQVGVSASLATLCTLTVLTLVLPNFAASAGPFYAPSQLAFVAIVSLLLYLTFVAVQTVRHRDYFLPPNEEAADLEAHAPPPSGRQTLLSGVLLVACLVEVVLVAKALAPAIEDGVAAAGAPHAVVGVVIAALVLLPESVAAVRALIEGGAGNWTVRTLRTGDMGAIASRQAVFYAEHYGWERPMELLLNDVTTGFLRDFRPGREQCWVAERGGEMLGSVMLADGGGDIAKLRLLYVEGHARGLGIGDALVRHCVEFARAAGYARLDLWTHTILASARRIYAAQGFELVDSAAHTMFGEPVMGETWSLDLNRDAPPARP